jgi:16S rRNA (uracil1498-N3)-methyltransferase
MCGVSAPMFLVDAVPEAGVFTLDGAEGHHAAVVQRLRVGETLTLADGRGGMAGGVVRAVGRGSLDIEVTSRENVEPPDPRITVIQALTKGDRGDLAIATMTEVGVDEIVPWSAARCVVRWRDDKGLQRWRSTSREAAKQSRRPWLPAVSPLLGTGDVAERIKSAASAYLLHESAIGALSTVGVPRRGEIVLVVGPEGGVDDAELEILGAAGAAPVRLGRSILRASTAGAAAICVLSVRLGRW